MRIKTLFPKQHRFTIPTWKRANRAQGMVEFALVLPMLMVLVFGVIEVGRMIFIYSAVMTASREAARYGSAAGLVGGTPLFADCSGIQAAAHRVGILANITAVNISYDNGPGTNIPDACGSPNLQNDIIGGRSRIRVDVTANFQPIVPMVNLSSFTINSTSARTIFSNVEVGRFPVQTLSVAGLGGVGSPDPNHNNKWEATVTITVHNDSGQPVQNAQIVGSWALPSSPSGSCMTNASGTCTITIDNINRSTDTAVFTVVDLFSGSYTYDASANIGSSVTVDKPALP